MKDQEIRPATAERSEAADGPPGAPSVPTETAGPPGVKALGRATVAAPVIPTQRAGSSTSDSTAPTTTDGGGTARASVSVQPGKSPKPTDPVEPGEPLKPTDPVEPAEPVRPETPPPVPTPPVPGPTPPVPVPGPMPPGPTPPGPNPPPTPRPAPPTPGPAPVPAPVPPMPPAPPAPAPPAPMPVPPFPPPPATATAPTAARARAQVVRDRKAGTVYGGSLTDSPGFATVPIRVPDPVESSGSLTGHILAQGWTEEPVTEQSNTRRVIIVLSVALGILIAISLLAVLIAGDLVDGFFKGLAN